MTATSPRVFLTGLLAATFHLPVSAQVLLASDTESELTHATRPPEEVVELILQSEGIDGLLLNECLQAHQVKGISATHFFSSRRLSLNSDKLPDYFVRPALRPYCSAFYGAHLFRYWLVIGTRKNGKFSYQIALANGGDEVRILQHRTNGYRDLELRGHNAKYEAESTWRYDGKRYISTACSIRNIDPDDATKASCDAPN